MDKPYKILFKFASRSRNEKFFKSLDNIISKIDDKENYLIVASLDFDDKTMFNKQVLERLIPYVDNHKVFPVFGYSKNKIDAINRDMDKFDSYDIIINTSDDMEFQVQGFDNIIRDKFKQHFPDTDGNIYFNDGYVGDRISTMSIIGKKYFDSEKMKGKIYHPSYISLWCDNEYTEVAKHFNKIAYFNQILYKHQHPANGFGVADEQLKNTESFSFVDGENYKKRNSVNFELW
jgi:hypothetical protein